MLGVFKIPSKRLASVLGLYLLAPPAFLACFAFRICILTALGTRTIDLSGSIVHTKNKPSLTLLPATRSVIKMRERSRIGNLLSRRLVSLSFRLLFSFSVFHVKDLSRSGLSTGLSARPSRRTFPRLYPSLGFFHGSFRLSVPPTASDRQGAVWGVGEKRSPRGLSTPNCWGPMPRSQN